MTALLTPPPPAKDAAPASGVLLTAAEFAALPDDERAAAAGPDAGAWRAARPAFMRAMQGFARYGFIVNPGVLHPGYRTAAAPVRDADGRPILALNCGAAASSARAAAERTRSPKSQAGWPRITVSRSTT